jgi:hypothetical protein
MDTRQQKTKETERSIFVTQQINYNSKELAQSIYECVLNNVMNDLTDLQLDNLWEKASCKSFQITFLESVLV